MFAGPNGSGKSTLKSVINSALLGIYINPDEIEKEIGQRNFLDLSAYGVHTTAGEVLDFFNNAPLLNAAELQDEAAELRFSDEKLSFHRVAVNAYFASVAADFIRRKLLETGTSFTFETVMSFVDKVELLREAQQRGFRTYLYFIATEDPIINISRVRHRVRMGGHPVPEDKIVSRYRRSLDLLREAVRYTHRAYIFDNSGNERVWLAEVTAGKMLELKTNTMPIWFKSALWDCFGESISGDDA
ncbi:MAG: zeta toxin family protein [Magnetococcales bacterium]|nr:zeta toxin family protein [Magnetococcales bacterium]